MLANPGQHRGWGRGRERCAVIRVETRPRYYGHESAPLSVQAGIAALGQANLKRSIFSTYTLSLKPQIRLGATSLYSYEDHRRAKFIFLRGPFVKFIHPVE